MILNFIGGLKSECIIIKETKQYITFRAIGNLCKYRLNKKTMEVQDGTYHRVIKGLSVTLDK